MVQFAVSQVKSWKHGDSGTPQEVAEWDVQDKEC